MSSQLPASDMHHSQVTTSETRHGRVRRPSEKVQAMLGESNLAKRASEHQAREKTKRHETLARRREQTSKAAEVDPFMTPTWKVPSRGPTQGPIHITPDNAFTTRSVGSVHTANIGTRPAMVTPPLSVRQGRVPPTGAVDKVNMKSVQKAMNTLSETPAQPAQLKRKKAYFNVLDVSPPRKRMRERVPSPYPTESQRVTAELEDLSIDRTAQSPNDKTLDEDPLPRKLVRHSVVLSEDELDVPVSSGVKAMDVTKHEGKMQVKAKAGDYDRGTRGVIQSAIGIYCATLLRNDPYPDLVKEMEWARKAWDEACKQHDVNLPHDKAVLGLITARTTHLRGQFKAKARPVVAAVYGFDASASKSATEQNRAIFLKLKQDSAFIFRSRGETLDEHTGIYTSPAIQQVINAVLFKNKNDDGIRWSKYYKSFSIPAFALTITAIECAVNEWESGAYESIWFKGDEYASVYRRHLASLNEFNTMTASIELLPKLLKQVYDNGCAHAGVANPAIQTGKVEKAVPSRAFLNAMAEFKRMEATMDQHADIGPEDNGDAPEDNGNMSVDGEDEDRQPMDDESDLVSVDGDEDEGADELYDN